ncbi:unnamed protein product, partial [Adineta steineri]
MPSGSWVTNLPLQ